MIRGLRVGVAWFRMLRILKARVPAESTWVRQGCNGIPRKRGKRIQNSAKKSLKIATLLTLVSVFFCVEPLEFGFFRNLEFECFVLRFPPSSYALRVGHSSAVG